MPYWGGIARSLRFGVSRAGYFDSDQADVVLKFVRIGKPLHFGKQFIEQLLSREAVTPAHRREEALLAKFLLSGIVHFVKTIGEEQQEIVQREWHAAGGID